jgi:hypothetical protein
MVLACADMLKQGPLGVHQYLNYFYSPNIFHSSGVLSFQWLCVEVFFFHLKSIRTHIRPCGTHQRHEEPKIKNNGLIIVLFLLVS